MISIVEFVYNLLIYLLNTVIFLLSKVLELILSVLPNSPFLNINTPSIDKYLSYLAWLVPIKQISIILSVWLSAMLLYYLYSTGMRWIKMID